MNRTLSLSIAAVFCILLYAGLGTAGAQESRVPIDISAHPSLGLENAPVTLVVFSDYL